MVIVVKICEDFQTEIKKYPKNIFLGYIDGFGDDCDKMIQNYQEFRIMLIYLHIKKK